MALRFDKIERALEILSSKEWFKTIRLSKIELFKILQSEEATYSALSVQQILSQGLNKIDRFNREIATHRARRVIGEFDLESPNMRPLKSLLVERRFLLQRQFTTYRHTLDQAARELMSFKKFQDYIDLVKIGRRGQDVVRELTLKSIERTFLTGNPTALGKREIIKKIMDDPTIKRFTQPDGRTTFRLHIFPYDNPNDPKNFRNYDVEQYAELTARTTSLLAEQEAFISDAKRGDTNFIKYNDTGISQSEYIKEGDIRCAAINDTAFAIGGTDFGPSPITGQQVTGARGASGKFYPNIRRVLTGFLTGHPNCNHIGKPFPGELL